MRSTLVITAKLTSMNVLSLGPKVSLVMYTLVIARTRRVDMSAYANLVMKVKGFMTALFAAKLTNVPVILVKMEVTVLTHS
jgi:hypothetical protein